MGRIRGAQLVVNPGLTRINPSCAGVVITHCQYANACDIYDLLMLHFETVTFCDILLHYETPTL